MSELLPVNVDGLLIYVETSEIAAKYGSEDTGSPQEVLTRTADALDSAKTAIVAVAQRMVGAVRALDEAVTPQEFTLEFAVKFSVEGNAIIAQTGVEANLKVTMKYIHDKSDKPKVAE